MSYAASVGKDDDPIHCPSYKPPAKSDQEWKEHDKTHGDNGKLERLWVSNDICHFVICQACGKPRLIYAWPAQDRDIVHHVDALKDALGDPNYAYQCGDELLGIEGEDFSNGNSLSMESIAQDGL